MVKAPKGPFKDVHSLSGYPNLADIGGHVVLHPQTSNTRL